MILLYTDWGGADIYAGQVRSVIASHAPGVEVVDLLHAAPNFGVRPSAHLLAALTAYISPGSVCLAVVDPGVGSGRDSVVMLADGKWYVGPDNGLLSVVAARASRHQIWRITWRPGTLSRTFHGRDLFAPIAAWIEKGEIPYGKLDGTDALEVQLDARDLNEIIYLDHYGNALTGLRSAAISSGARIVTETVELGYAPVFADVAPGVPFWYDNSIGLVEIAVNSGSAAEVLKLKVGDAVSLLT